MDTFRIRRIYLWGRFVAVVAGLFSTLVLSGLERAPGAILEFEHWLNGGGQASDLRIGRELAIARRRAFGELVVTNPAAALTVAIPTERRKGLPAEIESELEQHIAGDAELEVVAVCGGQRRRDGSTLSREKPLRWLRVNGRRYQASFVDPAVGTFSQKGLVIRGVAAGDRIAVEECTTTTAARGISAVETSGVRTLGPLTLLFIRVDFSDLPGPPFDSYTGVGVLDETSIPQRIYGSGGLAEFISRTSYGKASIAPGAVVTPVIRLPKTAQFYASQAAEGEMMDEAVQRTRELGINPDPYDHIVLLYSVLTGLPGSQSARYAGLGTVGGRTIWLQGSLFVLAHELGHNFGFEHADRWVTTGRMATSVGSRLEYGDATDVMGSGFDTSGFNVWYRRRLGWIGADQVQLVNAPGRYRLTNFKTSGVARTLALVIPGATVGTLDRDTWISVERDSARTRPDGPIAAMVHWAPSAGLPSGSVLIPPKTTDTSLSETFGYQTGVIYNENGIIFRTIPIVGSAGSDDLEIEIFAVGRGAFGLPANSEIALGQSVLAVDRIRGVATVQVVRSVDLSSSASVGFQTFDGTGTAGRDYVASQGRLQWALGEGGTKEIRVPLVATTSSGASVFRVQLSDPSGVLIAGSDAAEITILPAGAPDPTFSPFFEGGSYAGVSVGVQTDGTVLTVLSDYDTNPQGIFGPVVALDRLGRKKTGFAAVPLGAASGGGVLAVLPDDKILVAGEVTLADQTVLKPIFQLNADGTIDQSFRPVGLDDVASIYAIAPQADGSILIGGDSVGAPVRRLNASGRNDNAFSQNVQALRIVGRALAIVRQRDGKVLLGGSFSLPPAPSSPAPTSLVRLNSDGTRDINFSTTFRTNKSVFSVALDDDDSILVGGDFSTVNGGAKSCLARLAPDGSVDSSFGAVFTAGTFFFVSPIITAATIGSDGMYCVGGDFGSVNGIAGSNFVRLNRAGGVLPGFAPAGGWKYPVRSISVLGDGSVLIDAPQQERVRGLPAQAIYRFRPIAVSAGGRISLPAPRITARLGETLSIPVKRTVTPPASPNAASAMWALDSDDTRGAGLPVSGGELRWAVGDTAPKAIILSIPLSFTGSSARIRLLPQTGSVGLGDTGTARIVVGGGTAPAMTSPITVDARVGSNLRYRIPAMGVGLAFSIESAPYGFSLDPSTGDLTGLPLASGSFGAEVMVRNDYGTAGAHVQINVAPAARPTRLINLSTRGQVGVGDHVMITGIVLRGLGTKRVALRTLAPSLAAILPGTLGNPKFSVFDAQGQRVATNDDWQSDPLIAYTSLSPADSRESAVALDLEAGSYTVVAEGVGATQGLAIVEAYDLQQESPTPALINVSTRLSVGVDDGLAIAGVVVGGDAPRDVVIRAVGPSLTAFGVSGILLDPNLQIYDSSGRRIAENDDWATDGGAQRVLALGLAPTDRRESALLLRLPPGAYTALVRGGNRGTGVALVEVYDVEP